jgi:hypothetical protein
MNIETKEVLGQPSYLISSDSIDLSITIQGGHMAPVSFYKDSDSIQPYYISEWSKKGYQDEVKVLEPLRGDFFCCPFGGDNNWNGESHQPHGEPAYKSWEEKEYSKIRGLTKLVLSMKTQIRPGKIDKTICLHNGQNIVYSQNLITGFEGKASLGHHAILPGTDDLCYIDMSPIQFGITDPDATEKFVNEEYYSIQPGQRFNSLKDVPTIWKDPNTTDCSVFPNREGFMDVIQVFNETQTTPAWTAVTHRQKGYVWFSLKDTSVLPSTVLWMENRGRKGKPWDGTNNCIGLEDVCSYLGAGLVKSAEENEINTLGIPTSHNLTSNNSFAVNYIQGVCKIPQGFDRVKNIDFSDPEQIRLISFSGKDVDTPVFHSFVFKGLEVFSALKT